MLPTVRTLTLGLAKALGAFALARLLTRRQLRILGYHGIWFSPGHFGNRIFMKPDTFQRRMEWLARSGNPVLPLDEAVSRLYEGTLPDCAVAITIDDGWYGTYRHMVPVLEKLALPATIYVTTEVVDANSPIFDIAVRHICRSARVAELVLPGMEFRVSLDGERARETAADRLLEAMDGWSVERRHRACLEMSHMAKSDYKELFATRQFHNMTYEEMRAAVSAGADIQLHTHSHDADPDRPERIEEEIALNRQRLSAVTSKPLVHFCYPSGVYSSGMYPYLERQGIRSAATVAAGLNGASTPRYALSRILDGEQVPLIEIEAELSGFLELKRILLRRLGR